VSRWLRLQFARRRTPVWMVQPRLRVDPGRQVPSDEQAGAELRPRSQTFWIAINDPTTERTTMFEDDDDRKYNVVIQRAGPVLDMAARPGHTSGLTIEGRSAPRPSVSATSTRSGPTFAVAGRSHRGHIVSTRSGLSLHELFTQEASGNRRQCCCRRQQTLTYRELDERSDRLAAHIKAR